MIIYPLKSSYLNCKIPNSLKLNSFSFTFVSINDYYYEYKGVSLQASFSMLITLLFQVVLNFQSTKMILVFNIFSIFNLITLTYTKCYTNLSRNLTNYINQQKYFMIWFFNCFYLCQVIKIAWIINRKNFTFATKFIFLIGLISIKCLQSTKFKVKCYRYFMSFLFSHSRNRRPLKSYYKKTTQRKCVTISNLKLLLLRFFLFQLLSKIDRRKSRIET